MSQKEDMSGEKRTSGRPNISTLTNGVVPTLKYQTSQSKGSKGSSCRMVQVRGTLKTWQMKVVVNLYGRVRLAA